MLNNQVSEWFPGTYSRYNGADSLSCDSVEAQNSAELRYPQELLNSIGARASLPDHEIALKKGFIVVLLRNIKPSSGHVNGTRYFVENMTFNLLFLTSVSGSKKGVRLVLPRMNCTVGKDDFLIPRFRRNQFPIRFYFAMTIKKAQEQSISATVGIDLYGQCFSHVKIICHSLEDDRFAKCLPSYNIWFQ